MYTHVREGQDLDQALSAGAWNQMLDFLNQGPPISSSQTKHTFAGSGRNYINVYNGGTTNLVEGSVMGLGNPLIGPSDNLGHFRRRTIWQGVLPTLAHWGKFVVFTQPCNLGKIARAVVGGEVITKVLINQIEHDTCDISVGITDNLVSGFNGSADIVWKPSGTGVKWCLIRWPSDTLRWIIGKMDDAIAPGESKLMTVYDKGNYNSTSLKETVFLKWTTGGQPISANKEVGCLWNKSAGHWLIQWADCE